MNSGARHCLQLTTIGSSSLISTMLMIERRVQWWLISSSVDTTFVEVCMWEAVAKNRNEKVKLLPCEYGGIVNVFAWTENGREPHAAIMKRENRRWWRRQRAARVSPAIIGLSTVLFEFSFCYCSHCVAMTYFLPVTCLGCNIYEPFVALINQEKRDHSAQHDASQSQRRGETLFSFFTWDSFHPVSQNNLCFHNMIRM
jgi:hypothetical protein